MSAPTLRRVVLGRLFAPCVVAVALAAAASVWLDRSADRAGQVARVRLWAQVAAQVAAGRPSGPTAPGLPTGHGAADPGVGPLLAAVVRADPAVASVRVEGADGRVLGQAGDAARAQAWEDRTFALGSGPIRVRLGYRLGAQPLGLAVRGAFWGLLMGSVLTLVLATVAWSLRGR